MAESVKKPEGIPAPAAPAAPAAHAALHKLYQGLQPLVKAWEGQIEAIRKAEEGALEKVAPPGFSEKAMHELKRKYGTTSAFKIAWAAHNKHGGDHEKAETEYFKSELSKAAVTDGGMGDMSAPPAPNLGEMALSEHDESPICKCENCGRLESYAKGEQDMAKAMSPVVIARMAANKARGKAAAAPKPAPAAAVVVAAPAPALGKKDMPAGATPTSPDMPTDPKLPKAKVAAPKSQAGGNDGTGHKKAPEPSAGSLGKAMNPVVIARMAANKAKAKAAAAAPPPAPAPQPVQKAMNPVVVARMAANKAKAKAAQAAPPPPAPAPEVKKASLSTSSPAPAGGAAALGANPAAAVKPKKNPIGAMKTAVAGMKSSVAKLPGTAAAPKAPKSPALGAGTPAVKAEPVPGAAKSHANLPAARASAGHLMDTMLASHPAGGTGGSFAGSMPGPGAAHKITLPGAHLFGGKK